MIWVVYFVTAAFTAIFSIGLFNIAKWLDSHWGERDQQQHDRPDSRPAFGWGRATVLILLLLAFSFGAMLIAEGADDLLSSNKQAFFDCPL